MVIRESLPGIDLAPLQSVLVDLAPQGRSGPCRRCMRRSPSMDTSLRRPRLRSVALGCTAGGHLWGDRFYSMFYTEPVGKKFIRVCGDPACVLAGSGAVLQALRQHLDVSPSGTSADGYYRSSR